MGQKNFKHFFILSFFLIIGIIVISSPKDYGERDSGAVNVKNIKEGTLSIDAETSGSSPESGVDSKIKQAYDFLVTKGTNYGNEEPTDYPYTHSTYWQRIIYAAMWDPEGTAIESDVRLGKTFYSGSKDRVQKTGTAQSGTFPGASNQQYVEYDDSYTGDYEGEESMWTNTNSTSGNEVWYDTRTGLYWARSEPSNLTNSFTISICDFFTSTPRGGYSGSDSDCGDAINACGTLSLASTQGQSADTDWYLPTQKEMKIAYINGIYNQTGSTFSGSAFWPWSSTENSASSSEAWRVLLSDGYTSDAGKSTTNSVHCVRRDW